MSRDHFDGSGRLECSASVDLPSGNEEKHEEALDRREKRCNGVHIVSPKSMLLRLNDFRKIAQRAQVHPCHPRIDRSVAQDILGAERTGRLAFMEFLAATLPSTRIPEENLLVGRSQTYLGRLLTVRGLGLRYPSWTDPSDTRASHGDHLRDRPGR